MVSFDERVQRVTGVIHQRVAKFRGYKATYSIVLDLTALPNVATDLTVFMEATSTEWKVERTNGRLVRYTIDKFTISREELKVAGTYYDPRPFKDTFVQFGTTTPIYRVISVEDTAEAAGAFDITCKAIRNENARG